MLIEKILESLLLSQREWNDTTERRRTAFFEFNLEIVRSVFQQYIGLYFVKNVGEVLILRRDVGSW